MGSGGVMETARDRVGLEWMTHKLYKIHFVGIAKYTNFCTVNSQDHRLFVIHVILVIREYEKRAKINTV